MTESDLPARAGNWKFPAEDVQEGGGTRGAGICARGARAGIPSREGARDADPAQISPTTIKSEVLQSLVPTQI